MNRINFMPEFGDLKNLSNKQGVGQESKCFTQTQVEPVEVGPNHALFDKATSNEYIKDMRKGEPNPILN